MGLVGVGLDTLNSERLYIREGTCLQLAECGLKNALSGYWFVRRTGFRRIFHTVLQVA